MSDTVIRIAIAIGITVVFVLLCEKFINARKKGQGGAPGDAQRGGDAGAKGP